MKITTKTGFKCEVDETSLDDYRCLEAIALASDSDNPSNQLIGTTKLVSFIFGKDKQKLMDHIAKKNNGKIPTEKMSAELTDVINQINALKNS